MGFLKMPGRGYLHVLAASVLIGVIAPIAPVVADDVVITNTASARFKDRPGVPDRAAISNPTSYTAAVSRSSLEILKTADRASAEPGDTVVYRLQIRNTGATTVTPLQVTDTLPLGLQFVSKSVRGSLASGGGSGAPVSIAAPTVSGRTETFTYPSLAPQQTLTLVYAALLTPDAIRGTGRNLAVALGQTPTTPVQSNTASYRLQIRPGILSDCGTLLGRVFVDKNFDGEQQPGEAGVPNAVIFMDDGNRITTDANGLFSLAFVISGTRTGTLDLTSLPGYTIAPNRYRIEANSPSRLVRLAPGSTARMNFAVTPSFKEGGQR